jgi:DNA-binding transcriptional regulator LsrR (DeoR family)
MSICNLVEQQCLSKQTKTNEVDFYRFTTMTQGQAVSEPIQWIIIRLSTTMPSHEIAEYTDISDRKICDILAHFKKTGGINISKRERPTLHSSLQDEDIQV